MMEGPGADSEEKHEPVSDIDTAVVVVGLKALDPEWPIREATVSTPKVEAFYWLAITLSQTLGAPRLVIGPRTIPAWATAAARLCSAGLAILAASYFWSKVSPVFLFWAAFILTRPLGATVGDFFDKPVANGGLALSRPLASAVIGAFIVLCLVVLPQRAGQHPASSVLLSAVRPTLMFARGLDLRCPRVPMRTKRPLPRRFDDYHGENHVSDFRALAAGAHRC